MALLILSAVATAALATQLIKIALDLTYYDREFSLHEIFTTGGMPSSHAAAVSSLATIIYLIEGVSTGFVISIVLAGIVLRDAVGVRYTVGKEGQTINAIIKQLKLKIPHQKFDKGHRPTEVLAGIVLGVFIALLVNGLF
ncbi:divergent PAP2 family protein [Candidatus Woesearchaeota archaeon]|nr:divergent PAP2 family protein [Candidatus Woesearchaeota archaeon]